MPAKHLSSVRFGDAPPIYMELTDKELGLCLKALCARIHYIKLINPKGLTKSAQKASEETSALLSRFCEYFGED